MFSSSINFGDAAPSAPSAPSAPYIGLEHILENSEKFFEEIYTDYEIWKKTVQTRHKEAKKNPFIVALHGSHMSIESIYENRETIRGKAQVDSECSSGGDCRNIIFGGTIPLQHN